VEKVFITIYIIMKTFHEWLVEAASPAPAPAAPTAAPSGGGGSPGGGLTGTGTPFKYTPSNSRRNEYRVVNPQWYKIDNTNKYQKGCSGTSCTKSVTG
jgi:hypothetical protein